MGKDGPDIPERARIVMDCLGDELLGICKAAEDEIVLCSAFVKNSTLERILDVRWHPNVKLTCVCRWRPADIVSGASDIEIFSTLKAAKNCRFFVHPFLHAKYYRADDKVLSGSANLTNRGLGFVYPRNLELLVPDSADKHVFERFERRLFHECVVASDSLLAAVEEEVGVMLASADSNNGPSPAEGRYEEESVWVPLCAAPDRLYDVYKGRGESAMLSRTYQDACRDLQFLDITKGLDRAGFIAAVRFRMHTAPLVIAVLDELERPVSDSVGRELIMSIAGSESLKYQAEQHWRIVKTWLLQFLSDQVRERTGADEIVRGRVLRRD